MLYDKGGAKGSVDKMYMVCFYQDSAVTINIKGKCYGKKNVN